MSHIFRFIGTREEKNWKIDKEELYHMNVLRLKPNDIIEIIDGKNYLSKARVINISSKSVDLEEIEYKIVKKENTSLILIVGLLKNMGDLLPFVTEAGVDKIFIFQQQHNKKDLTDKNKERFLNIVKSSVKQCKRNFIPELRFFSSLKDCLNYIEEDDKNKNYKKILLDEKSNNSLLNFNIDTVSSNNPDSIVIISGSELGFFEEEEKILEKIDLERFSLGENILRSITACLCSCMIIKLKLYQLNIDN